MRNFLPYCVKMHCLHRKKILLVTIAAVLESSYNKRYETCSIDDQWDHQVAAPAVGPVTRWQHLQWVVGRGWLCLALLAVRLISLWLIVTVDCYVINM